LWGSPILFSSSGFDHHQAILKAIATDFVATPAGRADLAKGMFKALALLDSFWSWLYERAQAG